jgi:ribosomal subunit interface protein
MEIPLRVTFRDMDPSPAVEARIRAKVDKLHTYFDRITGCQVAIEAGHRHQRKGKLYNVRIALRLPGEELHVGHAGRLDHAHEDVYVAIRDAFDALVRRLEDHARRFRGDVKMHAVPDHGRVARLFEDYGFIETADGNEVYFHANSVADQAFKRLEVGAEVRVVIAEGESPHGAQASTVVPIGKHHIAG